jgi:hypothetical protein
MYDIVPALGSVTQMVMLLIWCLRLQWWGVGNTSRWQLVREETGEKVSWGWWGFDEEMWGVVDWRVGVFM